MLCCLLVTVVTGKIIRVYNEKNPEKIKWKELTVNYVIDSTGSFTEVSTAKVHAMKYVLQCLFLMIFH